MLSLLRSIGTLHRFAKITSGVLVAFLGTQQNVSFAQGGAYYFQPNAISESDLSRERADLLRGLDLSVPHRALVPGDNGPLFAAAVRRRNAAVEKAVQFVRYVAGENLFRTALLTAREHYGAAMSRDHASINDLTVRIPFYEADRRYCDGMMGCPSFYAYTIDVSLASKDPRVLLQLLSPEKNRDGITLGQSVSQFEDAIKEARQNRRAAIEF
jgi:hypothetical protein